MQQLDLALAATGRLGSRRSYVMVTGEARNNVVSGTLRLTEVAPINDPSGKRSYKAVGRIELQVETPHGRDLIGGTLSARLVWD